jgi:hypothetical protein
MAATPPAGRNKGKVEILKMRRLPEVRRDTHFLDTTLIPLKKQINGTRLRTDGRTLRQMINAYAPPAM